MRVQITVRHGDVPEAVKVRAEEQVEKLTRYDPRLAGAEIVFNEEKKLKQVEGIFSIDRSEPVVTSGEGPEFRPALDQMLDRAARKLRRQREQVRDHHHGAPAPPAPPSEI